MDIDKLEELIRHHNKKYWIYNDPEISDYEYDQLCQELTSAYKASMLSLFSIVKHESCDYYLKVNSQPDLYLASPKLAKKLKDYWREYEIARIISKYPRLANDLVDQVTSNKNLLEGHWLCDFASIVKKYIPLDKNMERFTNELSFSKDANIRRVGLFVGELNKSK